MTTTVEVMRRIRAMIGRTPVRVPFDYSKAPRCGNGRAVSIGLANKKKTGPWKAEP